jgi:hypothetical protein
MTRTSRHSHAPPAGPLAGVLTLLAGMEETLGAAPAPDTMAGLGLLEVSLVNMTFPAAQAVCMAGGALGLLVLALGAVLLCRREKAVVETQTSKLVETSLVFMNYSKSPGRFKGTLTTLDRTDHV